MKLFRIIYLFSKCIYVKLFAWYFYDKKYIKTKWFKNGIESVGWQWAARDIHYRLHTLQHFSIRWPVSPFVEVGDNIEFDPEDLDNMNEFGNYYQTIDGKITIGSGTCIAPNVGIITTNHNLYDNTKHDSGKDVVIGEKCWIGMNSVILPGVVLGNNTVVAAGSVVTKSFTEGNCVVAGNPAHVIKKI